MPSRPPPPPAKGTRHPGAGRQKGTPNKVSVEARQLVAELVNSPTYQQRLRRDFDARKVHPTIESMCWAYFLGKPRQDVQIAGSLALDIDAKITEERRLYAQLDVRDLEQLAAESQALVDRAAALAKARAEAATPPVIDIPAEVSDIPKVSGETLGIMRGSDNGCYGSLTQPATEADAIPDLPSGRGASHDDVPNDDEST
jgi:hypothetical protein